MLVDVPSFVLSPTRNWAASSSPPPATTITPSDTSEARSWGTFVRVGMERVLKGRCNRRLPRRLPASPDQDTGSRCEHGRRADGGVGGDGKPTQSHVLLCSSAKGEERIWVKGMIVSSESSRGEWIDTHEFGMWRDDGAIELLHV